MKPFLRVALLIIGLTLAGCNLITGVEGSGKIVTEKRTVSGFDSISLSGSGQLEVDQNGEESLSITADDNLLPLLTSEVEGTRLVLKVKSGSRLDPSKKIVYKVSAKKLNSLGCEGATSAVLRGIQTNELKLAISGSGDISADGVSDRQDVSIAGSGKYSGANLKSKSATISIAGSGDAVVAASETLDVKVAGSGSIKYIGEPKITQTIAGSGSIERQN
jgi:hypothetical protein